MLLIGRSVRRFGSLGIVALLSLATIALPGPAAAASPSSGPGLDLTVRAMCPLPGPGEAQCLALQVVGGLSPNAAGANSLMGYGPADLQSAYHLPTGSEGTGVTVAVVDAFDWPDAESDLAAYRAQFGLPPCTTANGCFRKVNQRGVQGSYPGYSAGWGAEIDLDIQMVSATCPNCRILLVEADSTRMSDLGVAVNTAVSMGAVAVSNSYGGPEAYDQVSVDQAYYDHPGVAIVASTGDCGWNCAPTQQGPTHAVEFPASSPHVVAVGGTTLLPDGSSARGWTESAWGNSLGGAGSGCSLYQPKPSWQRDSGCAMRTQADVSAVADPQTGVAVYYSGSWTRFGGTSASSPIIASLFAMAGGIGSGEYPASYLYANPSGLYDVVGGNNDVSGYPGCDLSSYLCNGVAGYDGPTGLGTPNGLVSFQAIAPRPATYRPLTPARILDTRSGLGLSGKLAARQPRTFQVWGKGGVPAGATAVTGNVTVVNPTTGWALFLGPYPTSAPSTSTINFSGGQVRANGVTVALNGVGTLSATYLANYPATTDLVFDVTGYFAADTAGATWHGITPYRMLDTRSQPAVGFFGQMTPNVSKAVQITGRGGVPAGATAITGNVTVTNATTGWAVFVGPARTDIPTTSNVNFLAGETTSNNLSVRLSTDGKAWVTFMGSPGGKVDVVLDVTGYYTKDLTGSLFVPIAPTRLLDTRSSNGLSQKLLSNRPTSFQVAGRAGLPTAAKAVSGNLTVVNQTFGWAAYLGPSNAANPGTSSINFVVGDVKANGVIVGLNTGRLYATYLSIGGQTTDLVWDCTGYFVAPSPG